MKTLGIAVLGLALGMAVQGRAAMRDTGPMGAGPSDVATPDASTLSKMPLPDQAPLLATPTAAEKARLKAAKRCEAWLQLQDLKDLLSRSQKLGNLKDGEIIEFRGKLSLLQGKYRLRKEADCARLAFAKKERARAELEALEKDIRKHMVAGTPEAK